MATRRRRSTRKSPPSKWLCARAMAAARLMLSSSPRYRSPLSCPVRAKQEPEHEAPLESIRVADYGCKISHADRRGGKNASGEGRVFKILHLNECPASPMEPGRGEQIKLVNPGLGTEKV